MANAFARELGQQNGKPGTTLSRPALELLRGYNWPGNVRQLRTAVEHGVVMCTGTEVQPADLPEYLNTPAPAPQAAEIMRGSTDFELETAPSLNLQYLERRAIQLALKRTGGNKSAAAELLGINRRTLQRKINESPTDFT
jgi:DNA-binding NtrC family response regulator